MAHMIFVLSNPHLKFIIIINILYCKTKGVSFIQWQINIINQVIYVVLF
jgi:hypothetical protein